VCGGAAVAHTPRGPGRAGQLTSSQEAYSFPLHQFTRFAHVPFMMGGGAIWAAAVAHTTRGLGRAGVGNGGRLHGRAGVAARRACNARPRCGGTARCTAPHRTLHRTAPHAAPHRTGREHQHAARTICMRSQMSPSFLNPATSARSGLLLRAGRGGKSRGGASGERGRLLPQACSR